LSSGKPTLQIDLDGTIARYDGWKGLTHIGEPLPNARHAMCILSRKYRLVCYTARASAPEAVEAVEMYLKKHGFPHMIITNRKDPAHLCIDDRALQFCGVWDDHLLRAIDTFRPWWEGAPQSDPASRQCSSDGRRESSAQTQTPQDAPQPELPSSPI
jgi:hypothetical protein